MAGALPAVKYQDVVAHDGPTNCVSIGARSGQLFVTGGDDRKVKLWRVGTRADLRVRPAAEGGRSSCKDKY